MRNEKVALNKMKSNSKFFYSYAKNFTKIPGSVGTLEDKGGRLVSDPAEKARILSEQYSSQFTEPDPAFIPSVTNVNKWLRESENHRTYEEWTCKLISSCNECRMEVPHYCVEDMPVGEREEYLSLFMNRNSRGNSLDNIFLSIEDIEWALDEIPNNAAPGEDGILPILLKKGKNTISSWILDILAQSFDSGDIPPLGLSGIISPGHKGGSTSDPINYRPISLTSHLLKTAERIVRRELINYLELFQLMDPNQHGSRAGRGTVSQLIEHQERILRILEEGKNADSLYLDYSKAFDKCDHGILLYKLSKLGIGGKLLNWIKNFITLRYQKVIVDNKLSDPVKVKSGIPQGTVLGPILFLIYVQDMGDHMKKTHVSKYVDDTKLISAIENEQDILQTQDDLEIIYDWKNQNNMALNGPKFNVLRYGTNISLKENTLYFTEGMENIVETKDSIRDLGLILDDNMGFKSHIEKVCKTVKQKIGWVLRSFVSRDINFMKQLWKTLIIPHIDYCSQIYMPVDKGSIATLEKLQRNFLNRIPQIRNKSYWEQLDSVKIPSIERRLERYRIMYVFKILENVVPNCGLELSHTINDRVGRKLLVPRIIKNSPSSIKKARIQSFHYNGSCLFNILPKYLRNSTGVGTDDFKVLLDEYLKNIPDEPIIGGTPEGIDFNSQPSNSILWQKPRAV